MPETRYTQTADGVGIAYQVVGDGPIDVVFVSEWWSHVELQWDEPLYVEFLERLASFCRLICFDKRGIGCSDPVAATEVVAENWVDDISAVMDAVGAPKAVLLGEFSGGQLAMMFAAMHPERTSALVLANTWARALHAADHPIGSQLDELPPPHVSWGTGDDLAVFAPSVAGDERVRGWYARRQRLAISPNAVLPISMMLINMDVRAVLPSISVPTLVLHRRENSVVRVEHGRHLAEHIDGATLVELPGRDQLLYAGDMDQLVDEIELFLTGEHHQPRLDRMLATVLFTDIVSSTEHAAEMGDRRWRASLDSHDAMMRRQFDRYAGHEIKTTGDGFLATFDSPARAIRCAAAIVESARRLGLDVRAGLHTGECERRGADIGGIAVHIAQRVCAAAGGGEVVVSSTVCDIVAGSDLEFDERGQHTLKGVPGRWSLFTLRG